MAVIFKIQDANLRESPRVWYDNRADDLTKEGMLKGIEEAAAFVLFLSIGVLERPYCQMEIRHALALKKPIVLVHEADIRHGGFDFRAAHAAADLDLQEMLDNNESLPFRRRGYERDGMLKTLIEHAGFAQIYETSQQATGSKAEALAAVPLAINHMSLDALFERPVQAELIALLLLQRSDRRFTSCVLVHGMGGTGKTVTAVAAVQDRAVRVHYFEIHWLTVGADAVGEKVRQLQAILYKTLTGKGIKGEEKDDHERQAMLVTAMAEKQRALVVLDDPWMPEQVRFLNPIEGYHTEHRLLITTRIRDLVPKATRVELPLMGKDEAASLLLDLANIEEAEYLKEHPGAAWPPQAAYTIAAECGLLPVTLTIAAQVVRSWGDGWEIAVLPLLREELDSQGRRRSRTSTAEERVIGAGLKTLEKKEDGAAVKALFHMFAVTHEDFVHPMAVIELLWRSCCASDAEKQESSLTTRLKVRQWTQLLVDHSLLLGSSSEGIHLHDILLHYLRKRLSAEEMRAEQTKVVEGMVAASRTREKETGRGLQDTGTTAKAFDGEEVDHYCCTVCPYHVKQAMDPSVGITEDKKIRDWILGADLVLSRAVATAVGTEGLATLVAFFVQEEDWLSAAKVEFAAAAFLRLSKGLDGAATHMKAVMSLIEEHKLMSPEALQLELHVRSHYAGPMGRGADRKTHQARVKELMAMDESLRLDTMDTASMVWMSKYDLLGFSANAWNSGKTTVNDATIAQFIDFNFARVIPLLAQAESESVGARREAVRIYRLVWSGMYLPVAQSEKAAAMMHEFLRSAGAWGANAERLIDGISSHRYGRHNAILRSIGIHTDVVVCMPLAMLVLEHRSDLRQAKVLLTRQLSALHELQKAENTGTTDVPMLFTTTSFASLELGDHRAVGTGGSAQDARPAMLRLLLAWGCTDPTKCVTWFEEGDEWASARIHARSSRDGKVNMFHPQFFKASLCASFSLASTSSGGSDVDSAWLDGLPLEDDRTLTDTYNACNSVASARVLCAEVFERRGRVHDALRFAQAECADPLVFNGPSTIRAGRCLGRCHAVLGQPELSAAALGSALQLAQAGRYLAASRAVGREGDARA
eukprot:g566.t1